MPRSARLDAPGILHHVIIRGIERKRIFFDDSDRDNLLKRLGSLITESSTTCFAWALLPNHAHFLFRTGRLPLASLMAKLLTGYAVSFNRRHRRHGQLFQNRYKSIICQEDAYLKELIRYIHLNPLRAKLVSDMKQLNAYPYSGHSAILGSHIRDWQCPVLSFFGSLNNYKRFVESGIQQGRKPELVGGGLVRSLGGWEAVKRIRIDGQDRVKGDERILGDSGFVLNILHQTEEKLSRAYGLKTSGYDFDCLEKKVLEICRLKRDDLYRRTRDKMVVMARSLLCYWAVEEIKMSQTDLAKRFALTQPAIAFAVSRGRDIAEKGRYSYVDKI